jgi:hypothetical protein
MLDNTIPSEARLSMYVSARYLQELEIALLLLGIPSRYERPGMRRIMLPRLYVEHLDHGELDEAVCAIPRVSDARGLAWDAPDPQWWFMWWKPPAETREPICPAANMKKAAHLIAVRLREEAS